MFDDKLRQVEAKFAKIEQSLGDPEKIADSRNLLQLTKTHAVLLPIITTYQEFKKHQQELEDIRSMVADEIEEELRQLAVEEAQVLAKSQTK